MPRLTLSEQVNAQASQIAELTAQLTAAKESAASNLANAEILHKEVLDLRKRLGDAAIISQNLEKLEKDLATSKSSVTYHSNRADKAEAEIEQAHAVLDGVDGAPAREYEGAYGKLSRNIVTRLAGAFLVIAKTGGVK